MRKPETRPESDVRPLSAVPASPTVIPAKAGIQRPRPDGAPEAGDPPPRKGRLFVLSGPSGVGKDAVLSKIRRFERPYFFTTTATTRPMRSGERDGVDYIFLDCGAFRRMIERGELLEWAEVYGNLYGVPKSQVIEARDRGLDVIVKVDVQGANTIKRMMPEATLIFLAPPDMPALERRLRSRKTETEADFMLKLETAGEEVKEAHRFDHRVVNHDDGIEEAASAIDRIIRAGTECQRQTKG